MRTQLFTLITLVLSVQVCTSQTTEASKSHGVGFTSQIEMDKSRPSTNNGTLGRIIQINIWYPAQIGQNSVRMDFSDYLRVRYHEMGAQEPDENYEKTVEDYFQWPISQGANKSLIDSLVSAKLPMKAVENSAAKSGQYPVILLMHGSAVDFAFLAESLVEQGFIAINVPIKGYMKKELNVNGIGMETEIRDYEFTLSKVSENTNLDLTNITALGFSFGGQSALGLACRNPSVKRVISYDGGIGDKFGARLIKESSFCSTENVSASIFHIYDASYTGVYLDKIKSFVYAKRTLIGLNGIAHWHFTSFGYLASRIPKLFGENEFERNGYETILKITEDYLRSELKNPNAPHHLPGTKFNLINTVDYIAPIETK